VSWLRRWFGRQRLERELDAELRDHVERMTAAYVARGLDEATARRRARLEFGGIEQVKEVCRDERRPRWIDQALQDARYALRRCRKAPGFSAVAVLTLAVGVGANTAMFSLVDAVLLTPLPIEDPWRIVQVNRRGPGGQGPVISYPTYQFLRDHPSGFTDLAGTGRVWHWSVTLTEQQGPERVAGELVTGNYFSVLGLRPALGRLLTPEDNLVAGAGGMDGAVAVISDDYWTRRFARNPAAVGSSFSVGDASVTIVGVAPRPFFGLEPGDPVDMWLPMVLQPRLLLGQNWLEQRGNNWLRAIGRLKPAVSPDAARESTLLVFAQLPNAGGQWIEIADAAFGLSGLRSRLSFVLQLLMGAVGIVMLIACANVAALTLARANDRRRELTLRVALGASRGRLIRQLMVESLVLSLAAGALGLLIAASLVNPLLGLIMQQGSRAAAPPSLDVRMLGFACAVALATGVLVGLMPALSASGKDKTAEGKVGFDSGTQRQRRAGNILAASQVALSIVLLMLAGLLMKTLWNLRHADTGFEQESVLAVTLDPVAAQHTGPEFGNLYHQLLDRVGALPGVRSVSLSDGAFFGAGQRQRGISVHGYVAKPGDDLNPFVMSVSPRFFDTMGIPIVSGRAFLPEDEARAGSVAIVTQSFARYYFGNRNPVGEHFGFGGPPASRQVEIIGLTPDVKFSEIREKPVHLVYTPIATNQFPNTSFSFSNTTLTVRTAVDSTVMAAQLRPEIRSLDPALPIVALMTMRDQVDRSLGQERVAAVLASAFGVLAAGLACLGLYGVMAYSVSRRTREFGVRFALGAAPRAVAWSVVRESLTLILVGAMIGLVSALGATRIVESRLFGVTTTDPVTLAAALALMVGTSVVAVMIPAWRASRVAPAVALRGE
jgi:putative ABC transport system permease protein